MSVTVMPTSKWQPSVLHLLPFSPNDAGASSSNSSLSNSGGPPSASYIQEEVRGFPALAISPQDKERLRSKSAGIHDKSNPTKQTFAQQQSNGEKERTGKPRAKSDYGTNADRKPEVVKFSINDINEQILGWSRQPGSKKSDSPDSTSFRSDGGETRVRPLPKPALKSREGGWPNARFWRSSCISPGELELQKHKNHLDIHTSMTRKTRRVKLNIRDLPRSKTPIGENDPDKLNMKHVIAFLQSNAELKNNREGAVIDKPITPNDSNPKFSQGFAEVGGKGHHKSHRESAVTSYAEQKRSENKRQAFNSVKSSPENFPEIPQESESSGVDQIQANLAITASGVSQHSCSLIRPGSYHTDSSTSVAYLDKQIGSDYKGMRPKSLNQLHERTEFRLPANLRHIRESANDNRPFRLHRFLTLVSNTSGSVNIAPVTKSFQQNDRLRDKESPTSRHRSQTSLSRSLMRSSSKTPRIDSRLGYQSRFEPKRSRSEAAGRYILSHQGGSGKEEYDEKFRRRAKSQESHYPKESIPRTKHNKNKIICLPVAPVEMDSDDDYNPLPSVPGRLDRKDLVLSAQGRAIIAKHFPPTTKLGKYATRPHSVKEAMRSANQPSEQVPFNQQRPHSMKNIKYDPNTPTGNKEEKLGIDTENINPEEISPKSTDWGQNISSEAVVGDTSGPEEDGISNGAATSNRQGVCPSSPSHSEMKSHRSKSSSNKSKNGEGFIIFPTEVNDVADSDLKDVSQSFPGHDLNSQNVLSDNICNINASARNGSKIKQEVPSPSFPVAADPVKLTLRKERNLTRELTYMVDMEMSPTRSRKTGSGSNGFNA